MAERLVEELEEGRGTETRQVLREDVRGAPRLEPEGVSSERGLADDELKGSYEAIRAVGFEDETSLPSASASLRGENGQRRVMSPIADRPQRSDMRRLASSQTCSRSSSSASQSRGLLMMEDM